MFAGGWIQSVFQYFSKAQNLTVSLSPHVRESRFENPENSCFWYPESMKFLRGIWKYWALESGVQLQEFGISLMIGIRYPQYGIQNPKLSWIPLHCAILLASHAGVFRGSCFSSLPTNTWSTENNIPFPLFYLRGKWPINSCAMKRWQAKLD